MVCAAGALPHPLRTREIAAHSMRMAHILIAYKQFPAPSVGHAGGESLYRLMEALHRRAGAASHLSLALPTTSVSISPSLRQSVIRSTRSYITGAAGARGC